MVTVNLIPQSVVVSQARRWRIKRWFISTLIAVCAVLIALGVDGLQLAKAAALQDELASVQAEISQVRSDLTTVAAQSEQIWHQIERAKAIRSKRSWSSLVALIDDLLPKNCWLVTFATDPHRPAGRRVQRKTTLAGALQEEDEGPIIIEAPRRIKIQGYAPSDAEPHAFIAALKAAGVFSEVVLERSQRQPLLNSYYFFFDAVCEW